MDNYRQQRPAPLHRNESQDRRSLTTLFITGHYWHLTVHHTKMTFSTRLASRISGMASRRLTAATANNQLQLQLRHMASKTPNSSVFNTNQ